MRRNAWNTAARSLLIVSCAPSLSAQSLLPPLLYANHADSPVRFVLKHRDVSAWFENRQVLLHSGDAKIRLRFLGQGPQSRLAALDAQPGRVSFLLGRDPSQWITDLPSYGGVVYSRLYPGVDMRWQVHDAILKSEFVLSPGADVNAIRLDYSGIDTIAIDPSGDLLLRTATGVVREQAPTARIVLNGVSQSIGAKFRLTSGGEVGFLVDAFDRRATLIIDPVLSFSTFLGGSGFSAATSIAADAAGNAYVAGWTESTDFPVTGGLRRGSAIDGFVAKFNASNTLLYCTYIGGTYEDRITGIAVDASGNAVIAGYTSSNDMPFSGALQSTMRGTRNAFVAKLNASGTALLSGTYLGGSLSDTAAAVALDSTGNVYVAGNTTSADFPVANAFQSAKAGQQDGFIAKLNSTGSSLIYSTYLGGSSTDTITALAVDSAGAAYVAGGTFSANFPTASAYRAAIPGQQSGFVTKLNPNGRALAFSTFLGGSSGSVQLPEFATAIAVDASGAAHVAGVTSSTDFPTLNPYLVISGGGTHGYLTKVAPAGNSIAFSTYFGGSGRDWPLGVAVKSDGSVYLCGYTASGDLPVINSIQSSNAGIYDAFLARFNASGGLRYSTYLGGSSIDSANAVAIGASSTVFLAGHTMSWNFPLASPFQSSNAANYSAFLARIADPDPPPPETCTFGRSRNLVTQNQTTRQVMLRCYTGPGGTTELGSNWLYTASGGAGWHVAGAADFNADGVPDLVWQNDTTGQVVVHYYGGTGGLTDLGYAWLYTNIVQGWHVVAVADFNRDGTPDLVWQNDATSQTTVHYYGGPGGASDLGWNWLYAGTDGAGWHIVAAADFNGDGIPDTIWQNDATRQVVIHYQGGAGGEVYLGWNYLYTGSGGIGWHVVAAVDLNLDRMPDLEWQNDATGQLIVHYYNGAADVGWDWISAAGIPGWVVVN